MCILCKASYQCIEVLSCNIILLSIEKMSSFGQGFCFVIASLLLAAHVEAIPLEQFYPFGAEAGDTLHARTLDDSSPVQELPSPFPYFGRNFTTVYVSILLIPYSICTYICYYTPGGAVAGL